MEINAKYYFSNNLSFRIGFEYNWIENIGRKVYYNADNLPISIDTHTLFKRKIEWFNIYLGLQFYWGDVYRVLKISETKEIVDDIMKF